MRLALRAGWTESLQWDYDFGQVFFTRIMTHCIVELHRLLTLLE